MIKIDGLLSVRLGTPLFTAALEDAGCELATDKVRTEDTFTGIVCLEDVGLALVTVTVDTDPLSVLDTDPLSVLDTDPLSVLDTDPLSVLDTDPLSVLDTVPLSVLGVEMLDLLDLSITEMVLGLDVADCIFLDREVVEVFWDGALVE